MAWFKYNQNNSGGSFDEVGLNIHIEAADAESADAIALQNSIYFNGVEEGTDCECCGDRWYPAYGKGTEQPCLSHDFWDFALKEAPGNVLIYADGTIMKTEMVKVPSKKE